MEHKEMKKSEDKRQTARYKDENSAALIAWKVVGGTVLAVAAVALVATLPDIKRYIKISTM